MYYYALPIILVIDMTIENLKEMCDKFDESFELEGGRHKRLVEKLLPQLEAAYLENKDSSKADWLVWMYGKLAEGEGNQEMLSKYAEIREESDEYVRHVAAEFKLFSMYDIIMLTTD